MTKMPFLDMLLKSLVPSGSEVAPVLPETLLPQLESIEARQALAEMLLALFERWEVHEANQAELLGGADLEPIRQQGILPQESALLQRVGQLFGIERALQALFPYAAVARDHWVWVENEQLAGWTPMAVMLAEGLAGIRRVRALLERQLKDGP